MMGEFLLLMVFLDKFWFGPVGKVLDERDQSLRGKLAMVKDNGSEVGVPSSYTCGDGCVMLRVLVLPGAAGCAAVGWAWVCAASSSSQQKAAAAR